MNRTVFMNTCTPSAFTLCHTYEISARRIVVVRVSAALAEFTFCLHSPNCDLCLYCCCSESAYNDCGLEIPARWADAHTDKTNENSANGEQKSENRTLQLHFTFCIRHRPLFCFEMHAHTQAHGHARSVRCQCARSTTIIMHPLCRIIGNTSISLNALPCLAAAVFFPCAIPWFSARICKRDQGAGKRMQIRFFAAAIHASCERSFLGPS